MASCITAACHAHKAHSLGLGLLLDAVLCVAVASRRPPEGGLTAILLVFLPSWCVNIAALLTCLFGLTSCLSGWGRPGLSWTKLLAQDLCRLGLPTARLKSHEVPRLLRSQHLHW